MYSVAGYPASMRRLINELTRLPSIGEKTAVRLAYHLLMNKEDQALDLSKALVEAKEKIRLCDICFSLSDESQCSVCKDPSRARSVMCVVEKPADAIAIEGSGGYRGLYHILHGLWSPLKGVEPEHTKIRELIIRAERSQNSNDPLHPKITEVVLATSTTVEGDATALYIAEHLKEFGIHITRIAQGLPMGGELEYADELTLSHALRGRQRM